MDVIAPAAVKADPIVNEGAASKSSLRNLRPISKPLRLSILLTITL